MASTSYPSTESTSDDEYTPPKAAWDLLKFIDASAEEILAKRVGCSNCPVNMLCEAGESGTGYVCDDCGSTGVWVDEPMPNHAARDVILIDCAAHKFAKGDKSKTTRRCSNCTGDVMELFVRHGKSNLHYVATEHAKVDVLERQAVWKKAYEYWKAEAAKK